MGRGTGFAPTSGLGELDVSKRHYSVPLTPAKAHCAYWDTANVKLDCEGATVFTWYTAGLQRSGDAAPDVAGRRLIAKRAKQPKRGPTHSVGPFELPFSLATLQSAEGIRS